ncbi:uncharacterized protein LOC8267376 [Ricinus communis]|uniref:uncharacterized protein LOC8267376 n=1 Tax=Ricinus communis TaxID=3988 RepID=UPI000772C343|nr:uncharacterized protein LOC8267376 [Ricinus communis]
MKVRFGYQGEWYKLTLPQDATVYDMKVAVKDLLSIAEEDQQFLCDGDRLEDHFKVEDYQMDSDSPMVLQKVRTYRVVYGYEVRSCKVSDRATVLNLKSAVEKQFGIPVENQALVYGKEMADEIKMQTYNVGYNPINVYCKFEMLMYGRYQEYSLTVHEAMTVKEVKQKLEIKYGLDKTKLNFTTDISAEFLDEDQSLEYHSIDTSRIVYVYGE